MFTGLRSRGGIEGTKRGPYEAFGVSWRQLRDLRLSYEEKIKAEIDTALRKACSQHKLRISHSTVDNSFLIHAETDPVTKEDQDVHARITEEEAPPVVLTKITMKEDVKINDYEEPKKEEARQEEVTTNDEEENNVREENDVREKEESNQVMNKDGGEEENGIEKESFYSTATSPLNCTYVVNKSPVQHHTFQPSTTSPDITTTTESHKHPRPLSAELLDDVPYKKSASGDDTPTITDVHDDINVYVESEKDSNIDLMMRNSPVKAFEAHELRTKLLKDKIAQKLEKEESRRRELEAKKEQDRLDRIRRREEKAQKVAANKAAILKKEIEKKKKIEASKDEPPISKTNKVLEEKGQKSKLRHQAAELRRKEKERENEMKQRAIEKERQLQEELQRKRLEMREQMRLKKQLEKDDHRKAVVNVLDAKNICISTATSTVITTGVSVTAPTTIPTCVSYNTDADTHSFFNITSTSSTCSSAVSQMASSSTSTCTTSVTCSSSDNLSTASTSACTSSAPEKAGVTASKYANIPSYEITPVNQDPLRVADNYDIAELSSEDSSDDEDCPKKTVPMWAAPMNLNSIISEQEHLVSRDGEFDVDKIFPPNELLQPPKLEKIFRRAKRRFFKRTSSAQWTSPMLKKTRPLTQNNNDNSS